MVVETSLRGEASVAHVTAEGLLVSESRARVVALEVALQVGELRERLAAAVHRTLVGPLSCKVTTVGHTVISS